VGDRIIACHAAGAVETSGKDVDGEFESCTYVEGAAGEEFVFVIGVISDESYVGEAKGHTGGDICSKVSN
jgi:hypothetical protein